MRNPYALTAEEIFSRVWRHFIIEKHKPGLTVGSLSPEHSVCAYRTPDGDRCAVGVLIPDDPAFEPLHHAQGMIFDLFDQDWGEGAIGEWMKAMWDHGDLLHDLQETHDTSAIDLWDDGDGGEEFRSAMDDRLRYVLGKYGLPDALAVAP